MKLSNEDKREIIRLKKEEVVSQKQFVKMFIVVHTRIDELTRKYDFRGEAVLTRKPSHKYPPEFKMEVIGRYLNGEAKISLVIQYNTERSMIISWLNRYEKDGQYGHIDKKKGRPPKMKKDDDTMNETESENNNDVKAKSAEYSASNEPLIPLLRATLSGN